MNTKSIKGKREENRTEFSPKAAGKRPGREETEQRGKMEGEGNHAKPDCQQKENIASGTMARRKRERYTKITRER